MLDPVSFTTTFITIATCIKDLIEAGESIHRSIEKVSENRRRLQGLTEDVLHTLHKLGNLTCHSQNMFQEPELLNALKTLKADMLYVHSECCKISPTHFTGIRRVGSQFKAWVKRNDLENKIKDLKEHVNKCYLQFTVCTCYYGESGLMFNVGILCCSC
ncbi:hypothetical protein C8R45DRAFT_577161 [Mycena sanguinolenta]|nr:hypothetical protein C8R45DRAFT_577161 [Mycena sanguinolenta]